MFLDGRTNVGKAAQGFLSAAQGGSLDDLAFSTSDFVEGLASDIVRIYDLAEEHLATVHFLVARAVYPRLVRVVCEWLPATLHEEDAEYRRKASALVRVDPRSLGMADKVCNVRT